MWKYVEGSTAQKDIWSGNQTAKKKTLKGAFYTVEQYT